jgi:hypothetical protein
MIDDTTTGAVQSENVMPPPGETPAATIMRPDLAGFGYEACGIEADAEDYFFGVAGIATGIGCLRKPRRLGPWFQPWMRSFPS